MDKLKILCLHGCRQNAEKFRIQTGGMRKILKRYAEFVFISAPNMFEDVEAEERSWWFSKPNYFNSKDETDEDEGFGKTLQLIKETWKNLGPFDGILGFSQGAALTAILCALKENKEFQIDFNFVIIVSGFKSKCSKHFNFYCNKISIPSLHVIGNSDEIVSKFVSEELVKIFENPVVVYHSGGHHVPTSAQVKESYRNFIIDQTKTMN